MPGVLRGGDKNLKWLDKLLGREERTEEQSAESRIVTLFSGSETISREQALQVPTVSACINKIADTISMLPVKLYQKKDGKACEIENDPRLPLLNGDTGDTLNTVEFWRAMIADYYVGRGAWAYINTSGCIAKSLHYVDSTQVCILQNNDPIFKAFRVQVNGKSYYDFNFLKVLRKTKDGFTNIPIQQEYSKIISAAYNSLKLEISMSKGSGCKGGFLKSKSKLSDAAITSIREGYESLYNGANESENRKIVVLNDGLEFQEVSSTSVEMQMNENKQANSIEICKLFGFPHSIIDGGATEEDRKQFIQAVMAVINQIETELDKEMLLEVEKDDNYYWALDTKELTRGSQKERYESYEIGLRNRFLQVDEVRKEEDYEAMGFNFVPLGLGDVLLDVKTMQVYTPNTGQTANLNQLTVKGGDDK